MSSDYNKGWFDDFSIEGNPDCLFPAMAIWHAGSFISFNPPKATLFAWYQGHILLLTSMFYGSYRYYLDHNSTLSDPQFVFYFTLRIQKKHPESFWKTGKAALHGFS